MQRLSFLLMVFLFFLSVVFACGSKDDSENGASYEIIDGHAHAGVLEPGAVAADLAGQMTSKQIKAFIMMSVPTAMLTITNETTAQLETFFASYSSKFYYMYGGEELQPLLHGIGRTNSFTVTNVYPNGKPAHIDSADMGAMAAVAANSNTYFEEFKSNARWAALSGKYVGFGELAPLHFSLREKHPFMVYPANHGWLKWLCDMASTNNMFVDLHIEATSETVAQLEDLLAHNRAAKIIWDHAGWSNTGEMTPALLTQMLADNANLYLNLKLEEATNGTAVSSYPLDASGTLKSDWKTLLQTYADRIYIGTDVKCWLQGETLDGHVTAKIDPYTKLLAACRASLDRLFLFGCYQRNSPGKSHHSL